MDPNLYSQILADQTAAQGDIPLGWHYSSDYSTLNMIPNPGYQGTKNYNSQTGQQIPRDTSVDDMMQRVTELMQN